MFLMSSISFPQKGIFNNSFPIAMESGILPEFWLQVRAVRISNLVSSPDIMDVILCRTDFWKGVLSYFPCTIQPLESPRALPWASSSVLLQVLKARPIPKVDNVGRDSSCPSKFTKHERMMLREEGFAREESTLSAGEGELGCSEWQAFPGQNAAQSSGQEGSDHWACLSQSRAEDFTVRADP